MFKKKSVSFIVRSVMIGDLLIAGAPTHSLEMSILETELSRSLKAVLEENIRLKQRLEDLEKEKNEKQERKQAKRNLKSNNRVAQIAEPETNDQLVRTSNYTSFPELNSSGSREKPISFWEALAELTSEEKKKEEDYAGKEKDKSDGSRVELSSTIETQHYDKMRRKMNQRSYEYHGMSEGENEVETELRPFDRDQDEEDKAIYTSFYTPEKRFPRNTDELEYKVEAGGRGNWDSKVKFLDRDIAEARERGRLAKDLEDIDNAELEHALQLSMLSTRAESQIDNIIQEINVLVEIYNSEESPLVLSMGINEAEMVEVQLMIRDGFTEHLLPLLQELKESPFLLKEEGVPIYRSYPKFGLKIDDWRCVRMEVDEFSLVKRILEVDQDLDTLLEKMTVVSNLLFKMPGVESIAGAKGNEKSPVEEARERIYQEMRIVASIQKTFENFLKIQMRDDREHTRATLVDRSMEADDSASSTMTTTILSQTTLSPLEVYRRQWGY